MSERHSADDEQAFYQNEEAGGFSFNLSDLRSMLFRQRYIIGACLLGAILLGIIITLLMTPQYEANVTVQIEGRGDKIVEEGNIEDRISGSDVQRYLQSQVELLQSRSMAARVANDLRLTANDNFLIAMNIEPASETMRPENIQRVRRDRVINALTGNVSIKMPFGSSTATIGFSSPDPKLAAKVANAYAENLITGNIERRFEATTYARDFLEKEISESRNRLQDSEQLAIAYAANSKIVDASDGVSTKPDSSAPRSITTANLVQMNSDVATARTNRILAEEKWLQAKRTPLMNIPEVLNNPTIQLLQSERVKKQLANQELLDRYKSDHPVMQEANAQIGAIGSQINRFANDVRNSLRDNYETARRQEASLAKSLEGLKGATLTEQNKRIGLNQLSQEVDTNRALYRSLLERYKQVSTSADIVSNNITIIDRAESADKTSPRPFINLLLATFAGLGLGLLLAFLRETFDDTVRSPDDVKTNFGLPLLGTTPIYDASVSIIDALSNRKSAVAEAYASVRSSLDFSTIDGAPSSILVTSSQPKEGKSSSSIAIAESFGRAGKKTLLVDADLRSPSLHGYLGLINNNGFVATLTGNSTLEREVQKAKGVSFDFLSCGPIPIDPAEIIVTNAITRFLEQFQSQYDVILFDGPPVMGLADSPQIARSVESVIFVVESGKVHGGRTKAALRRLNEADANILGVLLTKFDASKGGYGDYYGYNYSYGPDKAGPKSKS